MIDKNLMKKHFSANAKHYDLYAAVQRHMGDQLSNWVAECQTDVRCVLDIGCGTGYLTKKMVDLFPDAQIRAVDLSEEMIRVAAEALKGYTNIEFYCQDAEQLTGSGSFDLIVSNAAFQWFNDPAATVKQLAQLLAPGGQLVFSTFGDRTFCELHECFRRARELLGVQRDWQHGQGFLTLPEWSGLVRNSGLEIRVQNDENYQVEFPDVRSFLNSVKKTGANNASQTTETLYNRQVLHKMADLYQSSFQTNSGIYATYHLLFIAAAKESR